MEHSLIQGFHNMLIYYYSMSTSKENSECYDEIYFFIYGLLLLLLDINYP